MSHRFGISTFLALALLPAAVAEASSVTVSGKTLSYSGGDAANSVRFLYESDGSMRILEMNEDITVSSSKCSLEAPRIARCRGWGDIRVDGGGGNDSIDMSRAGKYNSSSSPITTVTNFTGAADQGFPSVLIGGDGNDTIIGCAGPDQLIGGDGNDTLSGGDGSDLFDGGAGADVMNGGAGLRDTVDYRSRTAAVTVTLGTGADGEAGEGDTVGTDIEDIASGAGDDTLTGSNTAKNTIVGGDGNDTINGLADSDELYGGNGDDTIDGSANDDKIYGEAGNDTLIGGGGQDELYGAAGDDVLNGGDEPDKLDGGDGNDLHDGGNGADSFNTAQSGADSFDGGENVKGPNNDAIQWVDPGYGINVTQEGVANDGPDADDNVVNFEVVTGTAFDDILIGNDGINNLYGLGGDDELHGLGGTDNLVGADGNDKLYAGDDDVKDLVSCGNGQFDEGTYQLMVDDMSGCETVFTTPAPADPDPEDPFNL